MCSQRSDAPPQKRAKLTAGALRELSDDDWDSSSDSDADTEDSQPGSNDGNDSHCSHCKLDNDKRSLLCCETCPRVYHLGCLNPPLKSIPRGDWFCERCRKLRSLQEVERILASRPQQATCAPEETVKSSTDIEYYVKWKERSYMHCSWVAHSALLAAMKEYVGLKTRLQRYERSIKMPHQDGSFTIEPDIDSGKTHFGIPSMWVTPQRVIAQQEQDDSMQYLVKWEGLGYDECTWESTGDLAEHQHKISDFQKRQALSNVGKGPKGGLKRLRKAESQGPRTFLETPPFLHGGQLHGYQLEGLNWLLHAWEQHQNVVLADEMGLGKTIQTIGLLAALAEQKLQRPHLIIVPLSTLPNWEREFAQWAPQLNVVMLHGNQAARDTVVRHELYAAPAAGERATAHRQERVKVHVLVTSYEMASAELRELKHLEWEVLCVDEGHRLKNRESLLFKSLRELTARHKVLLTGTPLQNNIAELFMLMHFLDRGKFGSLEEFEAEFASISHGEQVARLHALLAPHLLRRVKRDVLKQLPPKREQIVRVELSHAQKELYKSILVRNTGTLTGTEGNRTQTRLGHILMDLRKTCNHPLLLDNAHFRGLLPPAPVEELVADSGKLAVLDPMLRKLKAAGHRTLIYSQFTMVLDILEDWLQGRHWGYQRIDGSVGSAERQTRIDRFNRDDGTTYCCFLLSTRAGGLGINLATADTVIIFDSDWNPHNDLQAQARAHRLGQQKPVMIFRLVARATIEERMMQQSKRKLMLEHVIVEKMGGGDNMRQEELDDLLRFGAAELFDDSLPAPETAPAEQAAPPSDAAPASADGSAAQPDDGSAAKPDDSAAKLDASPAREAATDGPAAAEGAPAAAEVVPAAAEGSPAAQPAAKPKQLNLKQQEQAAGRLGGSGGRGIHYDDAALDRLLDRSALSVTAEEEENTGEGDFMKAFKVAHFTLASQEEDPQPVPDANGELKLNQPPSAGAIPQLEAPELAQSGPKEDKKFWEGLLRQQYADLQLQQAAALGKGKRKRNQVNYVETGSFRPQRAAESDASVSDDSGASSEPSSDGDYQAWRQRKEIRHKLKQLQHARPGDDLAAIVSHTRAPSEPPLEPGSRAHANGGSMPHGAQDAGVSQRPASNGIPQAVHAGAPSNGREEPTRESSLASAQELPYQLRSLFMKVLMSFGLGDRKASGMGFHWEAFMGFFRPLPLPALESYADRVIGVVGQQNPSPEGLQLLHGYTPQEVLVRLGMLHLIRMKVKQAALRPEQSFCISPALPDGKVWRAVHDRPLLIGVLKHGYGNWGLVVRDASLGLLPLLQAELEVNIPRDAVLALQHLQPNAVLTFGDGQNGSIDGLPHVIQRSTGDIRMAIRWVQARVQDICGVLEKQAAQPQAQVEQPEAPEAANAPQQPPPQPQQPPPQPHQLPRPSVPVAGRPDYRLTPEQQVLLQLAAQKSQAVMLAAKQARIAIQHQPASTSPAPSQAMPSPAVPAPGQNGIPWQLLKRYTPATHEQVLHQWQQAQFAAAASVVQQASSQPGTVHGVQSAPAGRPTITTALAPPSLPSSIPSGSSQQAGPTPPGAGIASRGPLLATGYPVGPHQSRAGPAGPVAGDAHAHPASQGEIRLSSAAAAGVVAQARDFQLALPPALPRGASPAGLPHSPAAHLQPGVTQQPMTAGQLNATMTHQPAATSHRPDISLQPVSNGTTQRPVSNKVTQQPLSHSTAPQPALQATQVKAEPASPVRQGSAEVLAAASAQNPAQPQTHVASQLPAASAAAAAPASGPTEPAAAQPRRDPRLTDLAAPSPFPQQQAPAALPAGRHTDHPTQQASSAALAASQRLLAASEELAQQQQPVRPVHIAISSPRAMPAVAHPQAVAPQVPSSRPAADAHTVSHAQRSLQAADRQASPTAMQRRESAQPAALQAKRSGPQLSSDSPTRGRPAATPSPPPGRSPPPHDPPPPPSSSPAPQGRLSPSAQAWANQWQELQSRAQQGGPQAVASWRAAVGILYKQLQKMMLVVRHEAEDLHRQAQRGENVNLEAAGQRFRAQMQHIEQMCNMLSTSCLQLGQEQQRARSIPVHQIPVPVISPASTHARIQSMSSGQAPAQPGSRPQQQQPALRPGYQQAHLPQQAAQQRHLRPRAILPKPAHHAVPQMPQHGAQLHMTIQPAGMPQAPGSDSRPAAFPQGSAASMYAAHQWQATTQMAEAANAMARTPSVRLSASSNANIAMAAVSTPQVRLPSASTVASPHMQLSQPSPGHPRVVPSMASLPPGLQQFALPSGQLAFRPSSDAADLGSRSAVQSVGMAAQQASVQLLLQTSQQISAAQSGLPSPQAQEGQSARP